MKSFDQLWDELSQKVATGDPASGTVAEVNSGVHAIGKKILEEAIIVFNVIYFLLPNWGVYCQF